MKKFFETIRRIVMETIVIYPNGTSKTIIVRGSRNSKIKVKPQKCYFERYKIDDRYYWYYDEEMIYHIEDSKTNKVVFIGFANSPSEVINEFIRIRKENSK